MTQGHEMSKCYSTFAGEMVPIDFPNAGVLQTFNLFKKKKKAISTKHNEMRYEICL